MASQQTIDVARRAKELYEKQLKAQLEASHQNAYVAIEPDSGDYFLGKTLSEAIQASRAAHPNRLAFVLRVGHETAVTIGTTSRSTARVRSKTLKSHSAKTSRSLSALG